MIVLVHGWMLDIDCWSSLLDRALADPLFHRWDVFLYDYDAGLFSNVPMHTLSETLSAALASLRDEGGRPYVHTVLVGHSLGGLLVRAAYLHARRHRMAWGHGARLVLLASLDRGLSYLDRNQAMRKYVIPCAYVCRSARYLRDGFRGSDFVTRLRLEWLGELRGDESSLPEIVSVRGVRDTVVRADDGMDLARLPAAITILVPDKSHSDLIHLPGGEEASRNDIAYRLIRRAILDPVERVPRGHYDEIPRSDIVFVLPDASVSEAWIGQLNEAVKIAEDRDGAKSVAVVAAQYSGVGASRLVLPWKRAERLSHVCDQYADAYARWPAAAFHCLAQGVGTIILADCLEKGFARMTFHGVYLADNLIAPSYDWTARLRQGQIRRVQQDGKRSDIGRFSTAYRSHNKPDTVRGPHRLRHDDPCSMHHLVAFLLYGQD